MEFGSIRRNHLISQPSRSRKTFSNSNLSYISCNSANVSSKTIYLTLPKDELGCEVNLDGRIVNIRKGSPAHVVGVLQIGDYIRIIEDEYSNDEGYQDSNQVKLQVTYGVLQVESRPNCPLVIEIGNRSRTSLGIALADFPGNGSGNGNLGSGNQIRITSIQPGSMAERCGYLKPGDYLTSVHIGLNQTLLCSPYYNSYQIAQILRQITSQNTLVKLTILPSSFCYNDNAQEAIMNNYSTEDLNSGGYNSTLTIDRDCISPINNDNVIEEEEEENCEDEEECVLVMNLQKDRLYEDWGFSLVDQIEGEATENEDEEEDSSNLNLKRVKRQSINAGGRKKQKGAFLYQIRPNGPAFIAGLRPDDRILQINQRNVSHLESTMLVPILASLEDSLSIVISRTGHSNQLH